MKRLIYGVILSSFILAACNTQAKEKQELKQTTKKEVAMKTIHLTKAEFLAKVANFETNPKEWKYLGDRFLCRLVWTLQSDSTCVGRVGCRI
jgi:hypothetical protein